MNAFVCAVVSGVCPSNQYFISVYKYIEYLGDFSATLQAVIVKGTPHSIQEVVASVVHVLTINIGEK